MPGTVTSQPTANMSKNICKFSFAAIFIIGMGSAVNAANIPVTNLNDSGPGSLRQAILDANDEEANPGLDVIDLSAFNGASPVTIQPLSPLPPITSPVYMDGPISETRPALPGDVVLNSGPGFGSSGPGPSLRPGVELDGSLAISTDDTEPGFWVSPSWQAVSCNDPSHVLGTPCYATDPTAPGNPELFVFADENKLVRIGMPRVHGIWLQKHFGSTIKGFVINRFNGIGVYLDKGGSHTLVGNPNTGPRKTRR